MSTYFSNSPLLRFLNLLGFSMNDDSGVNDEPLHIRVIDKVLVQSRKFTIFDHWVSGNVRGDIYPLCHKCQHTLVQEIDVFYNPSRGRRRLHC